MYYWEMVFPDTGEIMQYGKPFESIRAAVRHAKNYLNNTLVYLAEGTEVRIKVFHDLPPSPPFEGGDMLFSHARGESEHSQTYHKKRPARET